MKTTQINHQEIDMAAAKKTTKQRPIIKQTNEEKSRNENKELMRRHLISMGFDKQTAAMMAGINL
jgi:hypothetical protein